MRSHVPHDSYVALARDAVVSIDCLAIPRVSACCCSPCVPIAGSADPTLERRMHSQMIRVVVESFVVCSLRRVHSKLSVEQIYVKLET